MVQWLIFGSGLLIGSALAARLDAPHISPEQVPEDAVPSSESLKKIQIASDNFLPHAEGVIQHVTTEGYLPTWRSAAARLPGLTEAVAMYFSMVDEETPPWIKAIAGGALVYLISPLDFIPDNIPGIGQVDDMAVIYFAYRQVAPWIRPGHYTEAKQWLGEQGIEPKPFIDLGKIMDLDEWANEYENTYQPKVPQLPGPVAP